MSRAHYCPPSGWVSSIPRFDLVVTKCDGLRRNILADDRIGSNNGMTANGDTAHDHCTGIDGNMVLQRWIVGGLCESLSVSADRHILIDCDVTPDPYLTANDNTDRMREIDGVEVAEWNLTTDQLLQEGSQDCQLCLQAAIDSFRIAVFSWLSAIWPFEWQLQAVSTESGIKGESAILLERPIA